MYVVRKRSYDNRFLLKIILLLMGFSPSIQAKGDIVGQKSKSTVNMYSRALRVIVPIKD